MAPLKDFNILVLLIFFSTLNVQKGLCVFNSQLYKKMPALYNFDDYDYCNGTYCFVYAEIDTNSNESLARIIEIFSKDTKRHFRHDHLFFGVCLEKCNDILDFTNNSLENDLTENIIWDKELANYYAHLYEGNLNLNNTNVVKNCLNEKFTTKYGLQLRVYIEYCDEKNIPYDFDIWCYIFILILVIIFLLTSFSSYFDYSLKRQQKRNGHDTTDFYKIRLKDTTQAIFTAFSLLRNYQRLIQAPKNDLEMNLQFINGARIVGLFLVIMTHTVVVFTTLPLQNPDFFEKAYHRVEAVLMQNGCAILQIFFVLSGFLLYINFENRKVVTPHTSLKHCSLIYFRVFLYRILRLLPSVVVLLVFTASYLIYMDDGPFWRHFTEAERHFCRKYWWKNLFFINNNVLMRESCLHHTWYIATDMQLFEIFLFVIIALFKFPFLKNYLFIGFLFVAFICPAIVTYIFKLDAFFAATPETYRYLFFKDAPTFYLSYIPFYGNIGGYLFGVYFGNLYIELKAKHLKFKQFKWNLIFWSIFPFATALLLTGYFFVAYGYRKPYIWQAIYAGLFRNVFALIIGLGLLGLCFKLGGAIYKFLCFSQFRLLARISYQSYLWHVVIIRLFVGFYRQPIYVNRLFLLSNFIAIFVLTNLLAFIIALILEYPIAELIRCLYKQKKVQQARRSEPPMGEEMF